MSARGLLIDIDVLEFLRTLRVREQRDLLRRFREIAAAPNRHADYAVQDRVGRRVEVHVMGRFAIKYWDDFADRQVKILDLHLADRRGASGD